MPLDAEKVIEILESAGRTNAPRRELLQLTADKIRTAGAPYTSVYLYMLERSANELVLEAFSGRETEHSRIAVGKGVCGTAVAQGKDQNVGDVSARKDYIACNRFTKSELVVLVRDKNGSILGQIDVDSDHFDPFTIGEENSVKRIADLLGTLL
eukprot:TRINITY_DN12195_c0_g1_i1.p1 TRINITY_DN12195_c0_g1~~TRINITY_DN12195_c0_g1_i1.p1  ORF type:complete len:154 (+),score=21.45 TRINITY_DN12195_c0_g1_i1:291-752(+)